MGSSFALGGVEAWKQHGAEQKRLKEQAWGQATLQSMGLTTAAPAPAAAAAAGGGLFSPQNVQRAWKQQGEKEFGDQVWKTMTGQAPAPAAKPDPAAPPQVAPAAPPAPTAGAPLPPRQGQPVAVASQSGGVAKATPEQPAPMAFGYQPTLKDGQSLDQLSDSEFERERRDAFLNGKDSMAGMRQVRELLAQRNGYSAEQARTMSVAALEQPKAGASSSSVTKTSIPTWNLTNGDGPGAQGDYGTVGEQDLNKVLQYLESGGPVPRVVQQSYEALPAFGGAMDFEVNDGTLRAFGDLNTNANDAGTQAAAAIKHNATLAAPGGPVIEQQSSADGQISAGAGDLHSAQELNVPSYSQAGVMVPGGAEFKGVLNDYMQAAGGLRARLSNAPLDQVAPWQMSQQPITLNGDNTRDARLAAFAAAGEQDPSRSQTEALAASPFGTRDGQSMAGSTVDLSGLDARKLYGTSDRPTQVRSGVPGFNPGNY